MTNSLGHIDLTFCAGITRGRPPPRVFSGYPPWHIDNRSYASRNHSLLFAMPGIGACGPPGPRRWRADRACGPQAPLPGR